MSAEQAKRRKHDIAYACFIPLGLAYLIGGFAAFTPMDTGTAGGIGFLVLLPLTLAALVTVPIGIFHAVSFWRDPVLMFLTIATVLIVVQLFAEVGPVKVRNGLSLAYGAAVVLSEGLWFAVRRKRVSEHNGAV